MEHDPINLVLLEFPTSISMATFSVTLLRCQALEFDLYLSNSTHPGSKTFERRHARFDWP